MNFKKMMKRGQEGFTLVELIVVIAVLGILGGIAVPAYSGYVEKANMGADIALANEIGNALVLGWYSGTIEGPATVKVSNVIEDEALGEGAEAAMKAVFGENWKDAMEVKYSGWGSVSNAGSYAGTGYEGNEEELLNEVNMLTQTLSKLVAADNAFFGGTGLDVFMSNNEWDTTNSTTVGNAAVLYVANTTKNNKETIRNTLSNAFETGDQQTVTNAIFGMTGNVGTATSLATMYALVEGYAQFCGEEDAASFHEATEKEFKNITNASEAQVALSESLKILGDDKMDEYLKSQAMKDLDGYLNIMETIDGNRGLVEDNISSDTCFTDGTVANALGGYKTMGSLGANVAEGEFAVVMSIGKDGPVVTLAPFEMNN